MDDWGSEELSKLSMPTTSSGTENNLIDKTENISENPPADGLQTFRNSKDIYKNSKTNSTKEDSDDSLENNDGKEKTDATPENLKKIDDVISTSTTYCIGGDGSTNIFGEKPKTTIENIKNEDNSSNNTDTNHNRNVNYVNEIRLSARISNVNNQQCENKLFKNKNNQNFELTKTGVEDELKIIEVDDIPKNNNSNITNTTMSSVEDDDSPNKHDVSLTSSQNSFAFTIDFGNGVTTNNPNAEAKYKSLLERFQNRHKRGASMSKLEVKKLDSIENESKKESITNLNITSNNNNICNNNKKNISNQSSTIIFNNTNKRGKTLESENTITEANKVKMRIRNRSTSGIRDPSKRHSWSPRSSTVEQDGVLITTSKSTQKPSRLVGKLNQIQQNEINKHGNFTSKSSNKTYSVASTSSCSQMNSSRTTNFSSRTSAMQIALEKIDFLCQQPPLDGFSSKGFHDCGSDDVSETGTYTLDGDNYTEEQKEIMNIDKSKLNQLQQSQNILAYDIKVLNNINRPTDLPINNKISSFNKNVPHEENHHNQRKNVLEVSYLHESASDKPKISYLDKFKSRMKSKKSPEKLSENNKISAPTSSPTGDLGTFTSITTSGVLAKKSSLDPKPKLTRKSSLTTSQIDSSEYVSTSSISGNVGGNNGNNIGAKNTNKEINTKNTQMSHSFTDHQKAEYRLNVFTNQTDSQLMLTEYESAATPDSPRSIDLKISDTAVLQTAQSKNDWIQEWARNARARSVTTSIKPTDHHSHRRTKIGSSGTAGNLMTRSYNCDYLEENNSVFSDNGGQGPSVVYCNKTIERFKSHAIGDYGMEYSSSDPNVSRRSNGSPNIDSNTKANFSRPPLSPSKIPSPLHSIGRARSISKTRSSLQDLSPSAVIQQHPNSQDSDFYLQKTATAISNLSRKNSLKSLNSSNQSPKRFGNSHHYSADEYSPPGHHLGNHNPNNILRGDENGGLHRRNHSFDYRAQAYHNPNNKSNVNNYMSQSYSNEMNNFSDYSNDFHLPRPRKNSFDSTSFRSHQHLYGNQLTGTSPIRQVNSGTLSQQQILRNQRNIDQAYSIKQNQSQTNKRQISQQQDLQQQNSSPLRRSSSFSTKPLSNSNTNIGSNRYTPLYKTVTPITAQKYVAAIATQQQKQNVKHPLQKSASSNSFRKMYSDYDDTVAYYINDEDDLDYCSSEECDEQYDDISTSVQHTGNSTTETTDPPLTNTRYNKALLMRIERSKQRVAGNNSTKPAPGGVMACPNTPELPRRPVQSANSAQQQQRSSMRQSVPRDSSLNRLKGEVPNSLASAKKQILQTAAKNNTTNTSTQPRYLDISKYKPVQGANFLKKDESKSTLQKSELKKSPTNTTVTISRTDPTRVSNRSVKSVGSASNRPLSASNKNARDSSVVSKQKEVELEMWRRRAKYDPMKAAAEDKRRKDEAKKQTQPKSCESSTFLRSQSYHCGVVGLGGNDAINSRWTESSDEDGAYISSSTTTTN